MAKAIIFDWGRTLYDNENKQLFPDALSILDYVSKKYKLAIVSLATKESIEERNSLIRNMKVDHFFEHILIDSKDKDRMYSQVINNFNIDPRDLILVDDRTVRGISWGNKIGATTIWLKKGKFSNELPNEETGSPSHIIENLSELLRLL